MQLKTAVWIDKYVAGTFNRFLNVLVRVTGFVLRPNHRLDRHFKTIAICKFKGMGSIIQATPLLQTLRNNYPDAKIIFISTPGNRRLLELIPEIDEIITLNDSGFFTLLTGFPITLIKLMRRKIGLYIDLEIYSNFSSSLTAMSCSRNRVGFYLRSDQYRLGLYTHMMFYNVNMPIRETYLQMARILPLKNESSTLSPLHEDESRVSGFIKDLAAVQSGMIIINCNASDLREERKWPVASFRMLIDRLLNTGSHTIVLIGAKNERAYVEQLSSFFPDEKRVINIAGKSNADELIFLIRHAKLMITNDTGPMHIAYACKTKTLALFGPCSPLQYGNFPGSCYIYEPVFCSPCVHEFLIPPCKGNNICMKKIEVEKVVTLADKMLNENFTEEKSQDYSTLTKTVDGYLPGLVKRQKKE